MKTNFDSAAHFVSFGIKEKNLGNRESASGPGSYVDNTQEVRCMIRDLVVNHNIRSILDLGCGDWNWMKLIITELQDDYTLMYEGWDASDKLIKQLNLNHENSKTKFYKKDIITDEYPSDIDLIICRDVLFHMRSDLVKLVLKKIKTSNAKLFLSSTYNTIKNSVDHDLKENNNIEGWFFHPINLDIEPYNLIGSKILAEIEYKNSHKNIPRQCVVYKIREEKMIENLFLSVGAMKAGTTWH
jgi:SAM-dependent methyltransferase